MGQSELEDKIRQTAREALGYLNLSSGAPDARFQQDLNELFGWVAQRSKEYGTPWHGIARLLHDELALLRGSSSAFADVAQAEAVIDLAFEQTLAEYRVFHRDLLYHCTDEDLFRPLFLARVVEAVLQEGHPWNETDRIVQGAIARLNDFIGHRPVAVLHNQQKMEPYPHEWVRPVPLYLREAGVGFSPYSGLIAATLDILAETPSELLELAYFDPAMLDELAVDARAYDFDHPANKRVNYVFGQWDPHHIDGNGFYRRYVVTQVTFDALWRRVETEFDLPPDERLFEGAAVLAGTVLMGSGISGRGPDTHDSNATLAGLLPRIAGLRDAFYKHLLSARTGKHGKRLRAEANKRQQPFAGARQHLNQRLAHLRALQQQHVLLADLYARMGFPDASRRQISAVPVAAARMHCEIHCRLAGAQLDCQRGDLVSAMRQLREIADLLHRSIECGAMVDPWNILGFAGNFSLFPAAENAVPDHRVDQLIQTMEAIFALHSRLQSESAARGNEDLMRSVAADTEKLAQWWDPFATTEVSDVAGFSGQEAADSANHVAQSLGAWHRAGAAAGDVAFWQKHVQSFTSPRAYAQVIAALLEKNDHDASMALLMQWLSQLEHVPLEAGEYSFHRLALRWMNTLRCSPEYMPEKRWSVARRFLDFLEAGADEFWQPPTFTWAAALPQEDEDGIENTFAAAYEGVTYQDSTADGFEGEVFDGGGEATDYELDHESLRINRRLAFLSAVAELWEVAGLMLESDRKQPLAAKFRDDSDATIRAWYLQAQRNWHGLNRLMEEVHSYRVAEPSPNHDALLEYDRRLGVKEFLLENVISTMASTSVAARTLLAVSSAEGADDASVEKKLPPWERYALALRRAISQRDPKAARKHVPKLLRALRKEPLLYVPLSRGGEPQQIVRARTLQSLISELLRCLPRLGLWSATCELLETAREMETSHSVGPGAVSEFDRLFSIGFQAMVESLVECVDDWAGNVPNQDQERHFDSQLIDFLNQLTEKLLLLWLRHSSTLRLSVLEGIDDKEWEGMVQFVKTYGHDLFTPQFLNEGNLKAILHQGAEAFLERLLEQPDPQGGLRLIEDLGRRITVERAADHLQRVLQAILENDEEYNDYNHTTTQSDRGEMLYCLLDFLRLKTNYERTAWKLAPVVLAHEVLVRRHRLASAEIWRRGMIEQTTMIALEHLERYRELTEKYGMRLPTLADRLEERFVRPLEVDRIQALIKPAVSELRAGEETRTFDLLEQEISDFAPSPSGVGLDIPDWLATLDEEVHEIHTHDQPELSHRKRDHLGWIKLSPQQVKRELEKWEAG